MGRYVHPIALPLRTAAEASLNDGRFRLIRPFGDRSSCFTVDGRLVCPPHTGQDYGNFREGSPVVAQHSGAIEFIGFTGQKTTEHPRGMAGYTVIVRFGGGFRQVACHMVDGSCPFKVGDRVHAGSQIGRVGRTGQVDGAHLHNELTERGRSVDPARFLALGRLPIDDGDEPGNGLSLRPVRQQWHIPSGTPLWTGGPERGEQKMFISAEDRWSCAETLDGRWREIEYDKEIIWLRRTDIKPISRTRNPRRGFGSPRIAGPG
jgi:hypothetical protein